MVVGGLVDDDISKKLYDRFEGQFQVSSGPRANTVKVVAIGTAAERALIEHKDEIRAMVTAAFPGRDVVLGSIT